MFIDIVPNRKSPPAVLLRESYRDGAKVRKRTLANLSSLPSEQIELIRAVLRGDHLVPADQGLEIVRARPDGHVQAVLGTMRRIGLDRLLSGSAARRRLAEALIVARIIEPAAKLATARALDAETASHSLGQHLELGKVGANEVYAALDWLGERQPQIEAALARRYLSDGTLVLYDVTSTWLEGRRCPLARFGYSRDGRKDKLQIVIGLMCSAEGCPIAVEVFDGNTADPSTLSSQIDKLKRRFGLQRVVLVADRGLITNARIEEDVRPAGLDWLTALRAPAIRQLVGEDGPLQLSLFDDRDLAEIESPDYPGERLIVCRNPTLAEERRRKRDELLDLTERDLVGIQERVRRRRQPLHGAAAIGQAVGKVLGRRKVGKHFRVTISDDDLRFDRDLPAIAAEAALDGFYVLRTNLPAEVMDADEAVRTYKGLARVERAFRCLKTVDLEVRPVFHWTGPRVRAHVFLCMLAYHVEWHMRQALAPILFADHDRAAAEAHRPSPVAKAKPSSAARKKAASKRTDDGLPVHSFRSLMADLATLTRNTVRFAGKTTLEILAKPTPVQRRAFELLAIKPKM